MEIKEKEEVVQQQYLTFFLTDEEYAINIQRVKEIVEIEQDTERTVMGVIADAVNQVIDLAPKDIEEPPAFGTRVRLEYLFGMGKLGKKFALILNIDSVLSNTELLTVSTLQPEAVDATSDAGERATEQLEA